MHRRPSRAPTPLDYRQRGWTATLPQHPYRPRRKLRTLARAVVLHRKPGKGPDQDCRCPHRFSLAVSGCGYLVQAPSPLHLARPGLAKGTGLLLEGRPARPFFRTLSGMCCKGRDEQESRRPFSHSLLRGSNPEAPRKGPTSTHYGRWPETSSAWFVTFRK